MPKEKPESELKRLRAEQDKSHRDEVFGGLSPAEQAAYEAKTKRINKLEIELTAIADAKKRRQYTRSQIKEPSGTKNLRLTLLRVRLISPTAVGKMIRRISLRIRQRSEESLRASLKREAASKNWSSGISRPEGTYILRAEPGTLVEAIIPLFQ